MTNELPEATIRFDGDKIESDGHSSDHQTPPFRGPRQRGVRLKQVQQTTMNTQTDRLPRTIRQFHDDDDPWHEYDGEPLFDDAALFKTKIEALREYEYGRHSPRNGFSERTKIRTKDRDEFTDELSTRLHEHDETFIFGGKFLGRVDVHKKGPQRTDVWFSPSFGYPASLGGAEYARNQILLEVKRYECELFWNEVLQPLYDEYNEKYPY